MENYAPTKNKSGHTFRETQHKRIIMASATGTVGDIWRSSPQNWERGFFEELEKILVTESATIPKNVWDQILSTAETRKAWITAFTHFSVDFQDNYEYYETFGDALLDSALKYMIYTNASVWSALQRTTGVEGRISNISQNYASKLWMRDTFVKKFGNLYKYIRCSDMYKYQRDLMEDCMESIVFAIQYSLDKVTWKGQYKGPGFPAVNKFVEWLYQEVVKDFAQTQKIDSQFLKELVESEDFRYTNVTKDLELKYPAVLAKIPDPRRTFFMAYGPKENAGNNPFGRLQSVEAAEKIFANRNISIIQDGNVTVFYRRVDVSDEREIDKKMATSEFVKAVIAYMEIAHSEQVEEKRSADINGTITEAQQKKQFKSYGLEEVFGDIMAKIPSDILKSTIQVFEDTNSQGKIYIMWGVNRKTNTKEMLFSAEVRHADKDQRNALILKAAADRFGLSSGEEYL